MTVKILVVDDEPDLEVLMRQRFRKQIRSGEYEFAFAQDGEEALERLRAEHDFEVMLTDLNMPKMDGLDLLERVNHLATHPQPVVVSAYGDLPKIRTAMNRGAFDFLTKPIDFVDLETTILKALDQVRLVREASHAQQQVAAFRHELDLAHSIQQSILPQEWPTLPGVELFARMVPARTVGGDFFDFFVRPDGRLGVVVGDVSGKGIPAAFFMAVCRSLLRSIACRVAAPGEAIRETNRLICEDNRTDLFVTLCYGVLDPATGAFEFANAGHPAPFRFAPGGPVALLAAEDDRGTVVGVVPAAEYRTTTARLAPGEGLILYSDGITEARAADNRMYGERGLAGFLGRSHRGAARAVVGDLLDDVAAFAGGTPQSDDQTVLVLRRTPGEIAAAVDAPTGIGTPA